MAFPHTPHARGDFFTEQQSMLHRLIHFIGQSLLYYAAWHGWTRVHNAIAKVGSSIFAYARGAFRKGT